MFKKLVLAVALSGLVGTAAAEPVRFDFTFQENQGPARATGYIVFETDLIANPGVNDIGLPNAAVLDLSVTVSGATSGNGSFGLGDFCNVVFDTQGGTLDFGRELIGQPTLGDPWGTTVPVVRESNGVSQGTSGDFNLFDCSMSGRGGERYPQNRGVPASTTPNGVWYFTLGADGGSANEMRLISMAPAGAQVHHQVPASNLWTLSGLLALVAGFGVAALRSRSSA